MDTWSIDRICSLTSKPSVVNALHACREGHPLKTECSWRNAIAVCAQQPSYVIPYAALAWLAQRADEEQQCEAFAEAAP